MSSLDDVREKFNALSPTQQREFAGLARATADQSNLVPMVVESERGGERAWDIFSRLLKNNIVILNSEVNEQSSNLVIAQLIYLDKKIVDTGEVDEEGNPAVITLYINSPGGSVDDGLAIYDTIRQLDTAVGTVGMGMCASMGSFLLSAGTPGMRSVMPNARVMIHQPANYGRHGKQSESELGAHSLKNTRRRLEMYYANFMGLNPRDVEIRHLIQRAMEHDTYVNATMALKAGLVDSIVYPKWLDKEPERRAEFDLMTEIDLMELEDIDMSKRDTAYDSLRAYKELIAEREKVVAARPALKTAVSLPPPAANQP